MILIVDYGIGNLGSIRHKLGYLEFESVISSDPEDVARADKIILPGVGSFATGMANLVQSGLVEPLRRRVFGEKAPLLGICLGMQLLAKHSEEGDADGLGWLDADIVRFDFSSSPRPLRVPHVGWNTLSPCGEEPLLRGLQDDARFYFTHSYHMRCADPSDVAALTRYGYEFPSVVRRGNIHGTQFHPEKSHDYGMRVLANFLELEP